MKTLSKREYELERKNRDPRWHWSGKSITNHKRNGYAVNITQQELHGYALKVDRCEDCDAILSWGYGHGYNARSPVCDRRENSGALEFGNIAIVCCQCSSSKNDRALEDWLLLRDHGIKKCLRCGQLKPLDEFPLHRQKNRAPYRRPYCKACDNKRNNMFYWQHREARLVSMREYHRLHRPPKLTPDAMSTGTGVEMK